MLRYSLRRFAAGTTTGGFSSAAFTGEDGGAYEKLKQDQERLHRQNQSGEEGAARGSSASGHPTSGSTRANYSGSSGSTHYIDTNDSFHRGGFGGSSSNSGGRTDSSFPSSFSSSAAFTSSVSGSAADTTTALERPTIETYEAMTDEQLIDTLRLRDEQIAQLRVIYENFHYEADRHFRKMIFDYHDKTMQLSQVHGKMQQASLQINREALARMRDEQDRMTRDKRLVFTLCTIWSLVFWVWVRRHYVMRQELEQEPMSAAERGQMSPSIFGAGSYGNNIFTSSRRSGRTLETSWEREVRERREAQDDAARQLSLLQHQSEVVKAVAARDAAAAAAAAAAQKPA